MPADTGRRDVDGNYRNHCARHAGHQCGRARRISCRRGDAALPVVVIFIVVLWWTFVLLGLRQPVQQFWLEPQHAWHQRRLRTTEFIVDLVVIIVVFFVIG